jgi:hypothetical protein
MWPKHRSLRHFLHYEIRDCYDNYSVTAIWDITKISRKVISGELLTKQARGTKIVIYKKNTQLSYFLA